MTQRSKYRYSNGGRRGSNDLFLDPKDPAATADELLKREFTTASYFTLRRYRGQFYQWTGTHFRAVDDAAIEAKIYAFLEKAMVASPGGAVASFKPTHQKVRDVWHAVAAKTLIDSERIPPFWLGKFDRFPAAEMIATQSGFLHVASRRLIPLSPALFTLNATDFRYDAKAPRPEEWHKFLGQLWPGDPASIGTLQEAFGYFLTNDTAMQKILLIEGPGRSGKGTIAAVLTALVGKENIVSPSLAHLSSQFGPSSLIGKQLAIIGDARLGKSTDAVLVTEQLLSISGNDAQTIHRKFLPSWTGRLTARFVIFTNEIPRFSDASGVLAKRFINLKLVHSFYGKEDITLADRLIKELAGIFNWALEGLERLKERGRFEQPAAGAELAKEMEELASPVQAFIRERCVVDPYVEVLQGKLYSEFSDWMKDNGYQPVNKHRFGRDLRAAIPYFNKRQKRGESGHRAWFYQGVRLKERDEEGDHRSDE